MAKQIFKNVACLYRPLLFLYSMFITTLLEIQSQLKKLIKKRNNNILVSIWFDLIWFDLIWSNSKHINNSRYCLDLISLLQQSINFLLIRIIYLDCLSFPFPVFWGLLSSIILRHFFFKLLIIATSYNAVTTRLYIQKTKTYWLW